MKKSFGKKVVLQGVNLEVEKEGVFAILGPNGSGKTTMIKSILGMVIPDSGTVSVGGLDIKNSCDYRKKISYLPQIARFPDNLTVREIIKMVKDVRGQEGDERPLIECFKLQPFIDSRLRNLSGGTRQKVNIVLCFMFETGYIFLDEPTAGLDPIALIALKELIDKEKKKGKIIILTTHIMSIVEELADEIVFLLEGEIFFKGTLQDMIEMTGEPKLERSIARILQRSDNEHKHDLMASAY